MTLRAAHASTALALIVFAASASCRRTPAQGPSGPGVGPSRPHERTSQAALHPDAVAVGSTPGPRSDAAGSSVVAAASDAGTPGAARDAGGPRALTIRIVNTGDRPFNVYVNEDVNEMVHTRRLFPRRNPDASGPMAEGELVKFFVVGEMPLCSSDAGAGYGGLGQPEIRPLAPGQTLEYAWDGWQRVETNMQGRGVCAQLVRPQPARYRFEFDQPGYGGRPQCTRATVELPLAADAGTPVIEIRCLPPRDAGRAADDEG